MKETRPPIFVKDIPELGIRLTIEHLNPHDLIVHKVARLFDVTYEEVMGRGRLKQIVLARQRAYTELRKLGLSLSEIGRFFGGRCHTTIREGIKKVDVIKLHRLERKNGRHEADAVP